MAGQNLFVPRSFSFDYHIDGSVHFVVFCIHVVGIKLAFLLTTKKSIYMSSVLMIIVFVMNNLHTDIDIVCG